MRTVRLLCLCLLAALGLPAQETVVRLQRREPDYRFRFRPQYRLEDQRPFALALRGGSAKGLAHLGVLEGLEAEGLEPDALVGTSAGSLMGSLYASGFSAESIARIFKARDFGRVFDDLQRADGRTLTEDENSHTAPLQASFRHGRLDLLPGITRSRRVRLALMPMLGRASWLAAGDFDRLRLPFRAVASDLSTGEGKVFARGSLVDAVMASMCLPGIFEPVEIDGHQYVDGGPYENLPVMASRAAFPAMAQVGVQIGKPWDASPKTNLLTLLGASLEMAMARTEAQSRASADLLIQPSLKGTDDFDFHLQVDRLAQEGRRAFEAQRPFMETLLYGERATRIAASSLALVMNGGEVPGAAHWFGAAAPRGAATFGQLVRVLRKAHLELPVSAAELRLPADPAGPALLVLRPARTITRVELDLPDDWSPDARRQILDILQEGHGLAAGSPFNEGAWSQAIEEILERAVLLDAPILDVQGSGFQADGTLHLRLREPRIEQIRSHDPNLQASLERILTPLRATPVRSSVLETQLENTAPRLGLSALNPDLREEDGRLSLELNPVEAPRIELTPILAYETTWGLHGGLDATFNNLAGTGSSVLFHGAADDYQSRLQLLFTKALYPAPGLELGLGTSLARQRFPDSSSALADSLVTRQVWGSAQVRLGSNARGALQLDAGRIGGFATVNGFEQPESRAWFARLGLEWDSLDSWALPARGTLVRASLARSYKADIGPDYTVGYLRLRHLWAAPEGSGLPGLDLDGELGLQQDAPRERWFIVGGPDSLIGTRSAAYLVPNFAVLRVGFPFTLTSLLGAALQVSPQLDIGWFTPDWHHPGQGLHAQGTGLALRFVIRSFFLEVAAGAYRSRNPEDQDWATERHVSLQIGAKPFDIWKDR